MVRGPAPNLRLDKGSDPAGHKRQRHHSVMLNDAECAANATERYNYIVGPKAGWCCHWLLKALPIKGATTESTPWACKTMQLHRGTKGRVALLPALEGGAY